MRKWMIGLVACLYLTGCAIQGGAIQIKDTMTKQTQLVKSEFIYREAVAARDARFNSSYSIDVGQTNGPSVTLIVPENQNVTQLILPKQDSTEWIQIFDDRILCLKGDDGIVSATVVEDLSELQISEEILKSALDPVSLVKGRYFQKTKGAEEGSVQIATDSTDYWLKINASGMIESVQLYLSDVPITNLMYQDDVPLFPNIVKEDYPIYSDVFEISDETLVQQGYVATNDVYQRVTDQGVEVIQFDPMRLDYTMESEAFVIQLIYDHLDVKAIYTDVETATSCQVNLNQLDDTNNTCDEKQTAFLKETFENLKKEY